MPQSYFLPCFFSRYVSVICFFPFSVLLRFVGCFSASGE